MNPPTLQTQSVGKKSLEFSFVAIGDVPYTKKDKNRFPKLIDTINNLKPSLLIHVGDLKQGSQACGKPVFEKVRTELNRFKGPVVYTPGDNDWVDCGKKNHDHNTQAKVLAIIRKLFFSKKKPRTLGAKSQNVLGQAKEDDRFEPFVENLAFVIKGVLFLPLHVVGNETELKKNSKTQPEHDARMRANLAWLKEGVAYANKKSCRAIVIVTHANLRYYKKSSKRKGFADIHRAIGQAALNFKNPILLIQGDKHEFIIDHPPLHPRFKHGAPNVMRLQVMGGKKVVEGVLVRVSDNKKAMFSFNPVKTI